ncbi:MAG: hypothetical protein ABI439_01550 [Rhodospirillales bacterium]
MKIRMIAVLAMVAACLTASAAVAAVRVLSQVGDWQAYGGTATDGKATCGLSTRGSGKYFSVKYFYGNSTFTIQMGSDSWKITDRGKQKLTMRFDSNPVWKATGSGFHFNNGQAALELTVNKDQLGGFMAEFRASNALRMTFEGTNASGWYVSLSGTNAISQVFARCIQSMG